MKRSAILFSSLLMAFSIVTANTTFAQGDVTAGATKVALCATCHGAGGNSQIAENPVLAGQNAKYIIKQIQDYQAGARENLIMTSMVANLSEEDIQDIAAYYESQDAVVTGASAETLELGAAIYRAGNKEIAVAACTACHSPTGKGNGPAGFPSISGQHMQYTLAQLKAFRSGERSNDPNGMMRTVVERLTDKELEAVANYVSGLN